MENVLEFLEKAPEEARREFDSEKRILTYAGFISLLNEYPQRHLRDASAYIVDTFRHFGSYSLTRPWGEQRRWRLFDAQFAKSQEKLIGQERVQEEVYRLLNGFVKEGRSSRLIILHGPNGSSKSTFVLCMMQALENYSHQDEGAAYTYSWIFPSEKYSRSAIGFGDRVQNVMDSDSFANLEPSDIDAVLKCPVRDHPLLLLPVSLRMKLAQQAAQSGGGDPTLRDRPVPELFTRGGMCSGCRKIFNALMDSYRGNLAAVLRHIRVERYTISRGYRRGAVVVGPQLSVDASERQLTADLNLNALPAALSSVMLTEPFGPMVDAAGGILEFSDFLKRPLDSFKYLLGTIETGEVPLTTSILRPNAVLFATTNDDLLDAFKQHPEYASFRGRISLVKVPYLKRFKDEENVYRLRMDTGGDMHIAPHALETAARWAVLSRLKKPKPEAYADEMKSIIEKLSAVEKGDIYSEGMLPATLASDEAQLLRASEGDLYHEMDNEDHYEGRDGPSPRELRSVILAASENSGNDCLTVGTMLEELRALLKKVSEYPFLKTEPEGGGYGDFGALLDSVEEKWLDMVEDEVRTATGLVPEEKYAELFDRYINHVRHWVNGEEVVDENTGKKLGPDEKMMADVEKQIKAEKEIERFRQDLLSRIGGYAIEHPKAPVDYQLIFSEYLRRLKDHYFSEHKKKVGRVGKLMLDLLSEEQMSADDKARASEALDVLKKRYSYCDACATEALGIVLEKRYREEA